MVIVHIVVCPRLVTIRERSIEFCNAPMILLQTAVEELDVDALVERVKTGREEQTTDE